MMFLLVRFHVVYNVANLGRLERALQAAQNLVGAPRVPVYHEPFGESELAKVGTVSIASASLANHFGRPKILPWLTLILLEVIFRLYHCLKPQEIFVNLSDPSRSCNLHGTLFWL